MGIFSQDKTTTNQTAYNQQVGVSNRDLTGQQVTTGAGGATSLRQNYGGTQFNLGGASGNKITISTLDQSALDAAAMTINHAIDANTASTTSSLQGFQNALSVVAEHQQSAADLATGQQNSLLGQIGLSPGQIILGAVTIIGGLFALSYFKGR